MYGIALPRHCKNYLGRRNVASELRYFAVYGSTVFFPDTVREPGSGVSYIIVTNSISTIICCRINAIGRMPPLIIGHFKKDVNEGDFRDMFAPLSFSGIAPVFVGDFPGNYRGIAWPYS